MVFGIEERKYGFNRQLLNHSPGWRSLTTILIEEWQSRVERNQTGRLERKRKNEKKTPTLINNKGKKKTKTQ